MVWSWLFPMRCPGCGVVADPVCVECAVALRPPDPVATPEELDWCVGAFAYDGVAAPLIAGVKYRGARAAVGWLAEAMVGVLPVGAGPPEMDVGSFDAVTWAPTTTSRRRARGADHAALLARAVGCRLGLATRGLLQRSAGPAQTGRCRADRRHVRMTARVAPARVLVVDDVSTTGATLTAAARALRANGAVEVGAVVAGVTPSPRARRGRARRPTPTRGAPGRGDHAA